MRKLTASLLPIVLTCAAACAGKHDTNRNLPPRADEPENTKNNLKPYDTPNPGTSSGHTMEGITAPSIETSDVKITKDVRQALMDDRSLSSDAKNVEIATDDGVVTLRGPVPNERERKLVADKASRVAGVLRVDNQTEVPPVR